MYFYKNGKKVRETYIDIQPVKETYNNESGKKCPTWIFIVLGIISALVAIWLIWCIINEKRVKN